MNAIFHGQERLARSMVFRACQVFFFHMASKSKHKPSRGTAMEYSTLGQIVKHMLETKQGHIATAEETRKIRNEFLQNVGPDIQKIRDQQRIAFEESKNLTLR